MNYWVANIKRYKKENTRYVQSIVYIGKVCVLYKYTLQSSKENANNSTEKGSVDRNHQFTEEEPRMANKPHP